ncbi:NAD(P)/FAD-dependent oxidoreductase [Actinacidiphila oryziradicis]|uniref:Oxidoreductase n=1 Tax=Actinacidiphila oryziradicis TaxID=2571141 RepID=A0A4U0S1W1_9ACTN|nr:FAD-dependent oxidoreductase [Actinacidiphila oryziradicis]TKA01031.1 oxidoreductase [Actinacidiphila oryziradicis]TKA05004.1 oxidoreductase [Actinacidiphila oryziradicis]
MTAQRLVVVGASLAGLHAVEAARRAGFTGTITLIGSEKHEPYNRPPLSKQFLNAGPPPEPPFLRTAEKFGALDIDLRLGRPATELDTEGQRVAVSDEWIGYDALVIATGATPRALPGTDGLAGVLTLRTVDDARAVRTALDAGARTVVVGAGFIGSEVASAAHKRGLPVTIVEALPSPLARAVGEEMGVAVGDFHRANGVELRCGTAVTKLSGDGRVEHVHLSDGTVLDADLVVVGIGAAPETGWLESSSLTLDNGVVCDETLNAGVPGVYAAGDVARWHNPLFDRSMRLEHWTSASEQGAEAARNAIDPERKQPYETVPYFWSDWYDRKIQFAGLPDAEHMEVVSGQATDRKFTALYRSGDRLIGALTVNRPAENAKYQGLIGRRACWEEALEAARASASRATAAAAKI